MTVLRSWLAPLCAVLTACDDAPVEDSDFSGLLHEDLTSIGMVGDAGDGGRAARDLAEYDLTCDPALALDGTGDPRGTWTLQGACAAPDAWYQLVVQCAGITFDGLAVTSENSIAASPQGTLGLFKDATFSRDTHARLRGTAHVPTACTQPYASSCSSYESAQTTQFNWLDMSCINATGGGCKCAVSVDVSIAQGGTWAPSTSGFSTTAAAGGPQIFHHTVNGDVLRIQGDGTSLRGNRGITYVFVR